MPLLFGRHRGRPALAWLKHRRWEQWYRQGTGGLTDRRVTDDGTPRVTDGGDVRVIRPEAAGGSVIRLLEDGTTARFTEDGTMRITEAA